MAGPRGGGGAEGGGGVGGPAAEALRHAVTHAGGKSTPKGCQLNVFAVQNTAVWVIFYHIVVLYIFI